MQIVADICICLYCLYTLIKFWDIHMGFKKCIERATNQDEWLKSLCEQVLSYSKILDDINKTVKINHEIHDLRIIDLILQTDEIQSFVETAIERQNKDRELIKHLEAKIDGCFDYAALLSSKIENEDFNINSLFQKHHGVMEELYDHMVKINELSVLIKGKPEETVQPIVESQNPTDEKPEV